MGYHYRELFFMWSCLDCLSIVFNQDSSVCAIHWSSFVMFLECDKGRSLMVQLSFICGFGILCEQRDTLIH